MGRIINEYHEQQGSVYDAQNRGLRMVSGMTKNLKNKKFKLFINQIMFFGKFEV